MAKYARLRAFPPQAVLGPCFSMGSQGLDSIPFFLSAAFGGGQKKTASPLRHIYPT
jgi:hypothetical protein